MARERGWKTIIWPDARVNHIRGMGDHRGHALLQTQFRYGIRDQKLGMPLPYCLAKAANRLCNPPRIIGSISFILGFIAGHFLPPDREIPASCRRRLKAEQLRILRERLRPGPRRKSG